ncbi:MAG: hypothetical protein RLZ98_3146 [Pseudomonadota bacterium]
MDQLAERDASTTKPRIVSLDLLRGYAILGMLIINLPEMGRSIHDLFSGPYEGWSQSDQVLFWIRELLFEGNNRTLFTMLFGASFMILVSKAMSPGDPVGPVDLYYRRCHWMLLFGLVHATLLLWPSDILFHYALPAMAILPFRNWSPRAIFALAFVLLCVLNVIEAENDIKNSFVHQAAKAAEAKQAAGGELSAEEETAIEDWEKIVEDRKIDYDAVAEEVEARQSYFSSVVYQTKVWISWLDFEAFGWWLEAFTFMLIGIALFKLGIITGARSTKFFLILMFVALGIGTAINFHEAWLKWTTFNAPEIWQDDITYQFSRTATSIGLLATLILAARTSVGAVVLKPLTYVGRMPLTNYMGQSVIAAILFTGFGLFGKFNNIQIWGLAFCIWLALMAASYLWLQYFRMGPLEWLWRVLIHWKLEPISIEAKAA